MHLHIAHIAEVILPVTLYSKNIHVVQLPKAAVRHRMVYQVRVGHDERLGIPGVGGLPGRFGTPLGRYESLLRHEAVHMLLAAVQVQDVARQNHALRPGHLFGGYPAEPGLRRMDDTPHAHIVKGTDAKLLERTADHGRCGGNLHLKTQVHEVILLHEFGQRLRLPFFVPLAFVLPNEQAAQEIEHPNAYRHDHCSDRGEREETERLHARIHQRLLYDEVGRGTYQGEESHAAGECHGHQVTARTDAGRCGHAHHDRQHHRHRTRIAHEGPYQGGNEHHEDKKHVLVLAADTQDTTAYHLGETGAEDARTHDEQPHHHYHHRTRKTRKRLGGSEYAEYQQGEQGAERDNIGPDLTAHEKDT